MNKPYPTVERVMEITEFKKKELAEAAIATLKWLDDGAPHTSDISRKPLRFTMSSFIEQTYISETNQCGTACCIAGAIALSAYPEEYAGVIYGGGSLMRLFGIPTDFTAKINHDLDKLFYPRTERGDMIDKTPQQSAKTLRQYLFTGKVEW